MSADQKPKAVIAALSANLGIAVLKFVAFAVTGSASMLAEGVHSVVDSGNQGLLLLGGRRARQDADAQHQFGYGSVRYVYAFLVALVIFTAGGLFALYEGIEKVRHPHHLDSPIVAIVVLLGAIVLEGLSLRTAIGEAAPHKGSASWVQFIRNAKVPELPVVLLEDSAALVGLVLALLGVGLDHDHRRSDLGRPGHGRPSGCCSSASPSSWSSRPAACSSANRRPRRPSARSRPPCSVPGAIRAWPQSSG